MSTTTAERLQSAIAVVCPVSGVAIGKMGDSSTVRIDFDPAATIQQRDAAQSVVLAFDWSQQAETAYADSKEPDLSAIRDQAAQAVADINTYLTIADTATAAQVRAEVKAMDQRQRAIIKALARLVLTR